MLRETGKSDWIFKRNSHFAQSVQKQKIDVINFKRTDFSFHFHFNAKTGTQILFDAAILGLLIWLR